MTPPDLTEVVQRLASIETALADVAEDVTEVKSQATATNGKVAELKADQIRREAFRDLVGTIGRWLAGITAVIVTAILLAGLGL